ncbi:hypothetical protein SAMN04488581_2622 [Mycolicibacterium neoaurum]|uniref:hypothetical protein n=1 Tax=Mycolicibacterium neoaurum TaxID=1795 RepID=UPI0008831854|nr:hypothetical protein [Mycolicibacterium neoaurum]SDD59506.1 hypothetical protein SAMN04488581_2622 [Mycolicibacterium neoaurum]
MRLVKRPEFLTLPPGTLYAELQQPWVFHGLALKSDTIMHGDKPGDFWSISLDCIDAHDTGEYIDRLDEMAADPTVSYPLETAPTRGSDFNDETIYLVYEPADTDTLIRLLEHSNHIHAAFRPEAQL